MENPNLQKRSAWNCRRKKSVTLQRCRLLTRKAGQELRNTGRLEAGKVLKPLNRGHWFNPQAIIDGTMMLGAFHVTLAAGQETPFITGVACASFSWFIGLTFLISLISSKFNAKVMRWINIVCGVIIIGYGIKLFVSFVQMLL